MVSRKWLAGVAYALWVFGPIALPRAAAPTLPGAPAVVWREAPVQQRLFTPRHVPAGSYEAFTTPLPLADVLRRIALDPALASTPGAWDVHRLAPSDAFGQGGPYNHWAVARVYGGTTAQVARGPRVEDGRVVEAWTLISPFPDEGLHTLDTWTLLLILRLR